MKKLCRGTRLTLDRETLRELNLHAGDWLPRDASWTCLANCGTYHTAACA